MISNVHCVDLQMGFCGHGNSFEEIITVINLITLCESMRLKLIKELKKKDDTSEIMHNNIIIIYNKI